MMPQSAKHRLHLDPTYNVVWCCDPLTAKRCFYLLSRDAAHCSK